MGELPASVRYAFKPLQTAVEHRDAEVFAYFRHGATNAYTECVNGLIKIDNRMGRGYSFEALRAKVLLKHSRKLIPKPKLNKAPFAAAPPPG